MRQLFDEVKGETFRPLGLSENELQELLDFQYRARSQHYQTHFPNAQDIVMEARGERVGALIVHYGVEVILVDVTVCAAHRGNGHGTAAMSQLLHEATSLKKSVDLFVEPWNPAKRLYERLGFIQYEENEYGIRMKCQPPI